VRASLDPPLLAEIETRTEEIRGDLLADVAAELDVDVDPETPSFV